MSFSATRLTCFALLSALEDDMRAALETLLGDMDVDEVLSGERLDRAQQRRQSDGVGPANSPAGLLPYLDFGDSYELLMSHKTLLPQSFHESLKRMAAQLGPVIGIRNRVAHTRPMEIDDSSILLDIAIDLLSDEATAWPTLRDTMKRLRADPAYVLGLTVSLPKDPDTGPQHNLPVPDFDETGFFGRQDQLRRIKKAIKGAYPVVSILGDGGIGKTSIALKLAYELLDEPQPQFEAIVWVTAKATILTTNEIRRVSGAIETSLGIFAHAASELGGHRATQDPIAEVLAYLEEFRVLLILDNMETVLDARLRSFLLDLPIGSKVLVTSRIGLGIENPVQVEPLALDDSARLLRALARVRGVNQLSALPQPLVEHLAQKMSGHPAYIKWFVAGVQAGRRPEELIQDNALLLDFCMSNVYDYLTHDARAAVRAMQVLRGDRTQAEIAYLNEFDAAKTQEALLELLTTNFLRMTSHINGQSLDTVYQLSEFAQLYLDKHHAVTAEERDWLVKRHKKLIDLGSQLTAASSATPYSTDTVNVRGIGDVSVARILREAIRVGMDEPEAALQSCNEAQTLAPSYYEGWRIEGLVRGLMQDHLGARAAYERAVELASDSSVALFHYGSFLVEQAGDPSEGLRVLQRAARSDSASQEIAAQISWAHLCLYNYGAAIDAARHVIKLPGSNQSFAQGAAVLGLRAAALGSAAYLAASSFEVAGELVEAGIGLAKDVQVELLVDEAFDRLLQLRDHAASLSHGPDNYLATKFNNYQNEISERLRQADPISPRLLGEVRGVISAKGFGFIRSLGVDYFLHAREFIAPAAWEHLAEQDVCAFQVVETVRGPRAIRVRELTQH